VDWGGHACTAGSGLQMGPDPARGLIARARRSRTNAGYCTSRDSLFRDVLDVFGTNVAQQTAHVLEGSLEKAPLTAWAGGEGKSITGELPVSPDRRSTSCAADRWVLQNIILNCPNPRCAIPHMIERDLKRRLLDASRAMPVVTVTGPRQSGKTTLCRAAFPEHPYVNLEIPSERQLALEDPRALLARLPDGAVLDEIQRCPDLLSYIQGLVDEDPRPGRWILTGSQNLLLLESVGQSLAGRAAVLHLLPLTYAEVRRFDRFPTDLDEVLLTGGYPRVLDRGMPPREFLDPYIATYVERYVRAVSRVGDLVTFQRFMSLCAGRTGQLLNLSTLASDTGISQPTAKAWLSILEASFIVMQLPAWHGNLRKRLVKAPKLHFWDSGLVCRLLGIRDAQQLRLHPLRGSIFESWVVSEVAKTRLNLGERGGLFHLRDQHGHEVDLVEETDAGLRLTEVKAGTTVTGDMMSGLVRASEEGLIAATGSRRIVYGGATREVRSSCEILPWSMLATDDV
jgi:uncharacterized protein